MGQRGPLLHMSSRVGINARRAMDIELVGAPKHRSDE